MELLAVGIGVPLFLQLTGGLGQVILHGRLVIALVAHFLTEQFTYQAGKTRVVLYCPDAGPADDFFTIIAILFKPEFFNIGKVSCSATCLFCLDQVF